MNGTRPSPRRGGAGRVVPGGSGPASAPVRCAATRPARARRRPGRRRPSSPH